MTDTVLERDYLLPDKTYDVLKPVTQLVLPATGTFYFTLASIWGLPAAEEVVGTIVAVTTLLGVVLRLSSKSYDNSEAKYDGVIHVEKTPEKTVYDLHLNIDPDTFQTRGQLLFNLEKQ